MFKLICFKYFLKMMENMTLSNLGFQPGTQLSGLLMVDHYCIKFICKCNCNCSTQCACKMLPQECNPAVKIDFELYKVNCTGIRNYFFFVLPVKIFDLEIFLSVDLSNSKRKNLYLLLYPFFS